MPIGTIRAIRRKSHLKRENPLTGVRLCGNRIDSLKVYKENIKDRTDSEFNGKIYLFSLYYLKKK